MTEPVTVSPDDLPLQCLYRWERERGDQIFLTQPMGAGQVQNITWAEAADQARRMATWLTAQGWPEGSRVAIIGKNSAHWILADLAILMAGYVSVPIYPTFNGEALGYILEHSQARACFVGKMDDIANLKSGIPADMPVITMPLAPILKALLWTDLIAKSAPLAGTPAPQMDALCTIIYTSGTTGKPKGVVQTFRAISWALTSATRRVKMGANERYISYLPLAHVAERMLRKRYGEAAFAAYLRRREATRQSAQAYDARALLGDLGIIYNFGNDLIDDQQIEISAEQIKVPGFAQPLLFKKDERYGDMLD